MSRATRRGLHSIGCWGGAVKSAPLQEKVLYPHPGKNERHGARKRAALVGDISGNPRDYSARIARPASCFRVSESIRRSLGEGGPEARDEAARIERVAPLARAAQDLFAIRHSLFALRKDP